MSSPEALPHRHDGSGLTLRRLGIDTYQEAVIYMDRGCGVCRAEGFTAQSRVRVSLGPKEVIATLNVVTGGLLQPGEAGLSESAWHALEAREGVLAQVSHPEPIESLSALRAKVYGHRLELPAWRQMMGDVVSGRYSDLHLAALVTACAGDRLDLAETVALTQAMIEQGQRLSWSAPVVADKHCVGGLPGNRTTLIVVPIVAAAGLTIPKTSSRAITSPAGTADTMEVMAPVALELPAMRRVVESEGGCVVWGGSVRLSPADDVLIRIERPLDFDSDGQLVASILSKKLAAGSTHVLIDMPTGPTAKVRSPEAAISLKARLLATAEALGLAVRVVQTDGSQPVGFGLGPSLEARDVLQVLRTETGAPADLRERSLALAGEVLDLVPGAIPGQGRERAQVLLDSGEAWRKFHAICEAPGGFSEPGRAAFREPLLAGRGGVVRRIDNRRLAKVAKLAGAPGAAVAGLDCRRRIGDRVDAGDVLLEVHARSRGELEYALDYARAHPDIFELGESP